MVSVSTVVKKYVEGLLRTKGNLENVNSYKHTCGQSGQPRATERYAGQKLGPGEGRDFSKTLEAIQKEAELSESG